MKRNLLMVVVVLESLSVETPFPSRQSWVNVVETKGFAPSPVRIHSPSAHCAVPEK
jgi:hypothetical protein